MPSDKAEGLSEMEALRNKIAMLINENTELKAQNDRLEDALKGTRLEIEGLKDALNAAGVS